MRHGPLRIFSGNAHLTLARRIAESMDTSLASASVGRFDCGEVSVVINESVRDCDVFIIQPTCNGGRGPQEHFFELLVMIDAIRRSAANRITAVIPHYGYARQSAKEQSRTPLTAKLVTDLLQVAGADRVMTVELRVAQIQGFATYPVDNLQCFTLLGKEVEAIMASRGLVGDDMVVVSPDADGAKRAAALAKRLRAPLAVFTKQRRHQAQTAELDLVGEVEGKTCIIVENLVDTSCNICDAADRLMAKGARTVIGVAAHGVLSGPACETINSSCLELLIVTDTIPLEEKSARCPKLRVISVAPLLAEAIEIIHTSESLGRLFKSAPTSLE